MYSEKEIFTRTRRLVGDEAMERLHAARVIVFGVGGVGGWCAESLVRSGIRRLTIVDMDDVAPSNLNRQLPATVSAIGQAKVDVLRSRFRDINPHAEVVGLRRRYTAETSASFGLEGYDYVVDAIDSLEDKAHLILTATACGTRLFSSMGAALKLDPARIDVAEFWKVKGCPLAAALRRRFKKRGEFPARKFRCVYSEELLENLGTTDEDPGTKARVNGTFAHATAIFGFTLAGLVVQDILKAPSDPVLQKNDPVLPVSGPYLAKKDGGE